MKVFYYYIKRFWQIPLIEKVLLIKGILLCMSFVPVVHLLPLKNYIWLLKTKPKSPVDVNNKKYFVRMVRKTMRRIERLCPFRFNCLVRSITFKMLLNSLGMRSNIALGIDNSQPKLLRAHAFVKVKDEVVYLKKRKFYEVYSLE
jgi:hypothetical protein